MATSGPRPPRRPVVGSRNPTGRPRRVAGQRPSDLDAASEATPVETHEPELTPVEPVETPVETYDPGPPPVEPVETPADTSSDTPERTRRMLASSRTTVALVAALVLLVGAGAVEGWYLWLRDEPVVSAERPVVVGEIAHRAAVEAASQSTAEILTYGYQDFDAEMDEATSKMTDSFAQQFRETADDIEADFVAAKTEQEVKVVGASVVQASAEQVRALLFIDQYVARQGKGTSVTPYRALVTVVHTDSGWLVSNIETR